MKKVLSIMMILIVMLLASCGDDYEITIDLNIGVDTVEINQIWTDSGAVVHLENESITIFSTDTVNTTILGEYEIVYGYVDDENNDYSITRFVMVTDQTAPVLTIMAGIDTVQLNDNWIDGGCEVTDNSLEELTCTTTSVVNTSVIGVYEVIYSATDSSGNEGLITRIVTVVE